RGAITFNTTLTDSFVLEIKFGQEWSLFRFDDDVTAGTTWTFALPGAPNLQGLGLSHASVSTVAPVPEPQTYALMLAGLAGLAFVARRRRT
ncbi:MAG: FxDxF family PEP-CTERM protein, partial [Luteibacter sp.]